MRNIFRSASSIVILAGCALAQSNPFTGTWTNVAGYSSGATHRLVISSDASLHGYGSCTGGECDWGSVPLKVLAAFTGKPNTTGTYGVAQFSNLLLTIHLDGPRMMLDLYDTTNAGAYFHITDIMRLGPPTPAQMSPLDYTTFDIYPRTTVLKWQGNSEAISYGVEIDVYDMCQDGAWCSDVGGQTQIVENLSSPTYTFNFVGAQPGRWRVWSIGQDGTRSPKSEWWTFTYTQ